MRRVVIAAVAVLASQVAHAMSFHASPPYLFLGGTVVRSDWEAWEEAMIRFDGKIEAVVFHNSGGGDSQAGRKIGEDIRKRNLSTVVLGRCSSACANMFLGGVTRQFAEPQTGLHTVLGYHGSYNKKTHEMNKKKTGDYFLDMTDGKMREDFVERFIRLENRKGLLRFIHPEQRARPTEPLAQLCKGDEERTQRDTTCEKLEGVDALDKGIVTTWTTRAVPAYPKPVKDKGTYRGWDP